MLAALAPEQRAIAEQVMRGGLAGVRTAVDEQNKQARAAGAPEIRADAILSLAEELLRGVQAAEWRDKAEAAAAIVDEISLRDLRTVVAGADAGGRDEESRALAGRLREELERRSAAERQTWIDEISTCLAEGRVVRALRVSSRAPEQGLRLPPELSTGLSTAAGEAMSADTAADRWLAVLEAVLASPVRRTIAPKALPNGADEATLKTIRAAIPKVPALGPLLGETPSSRPVPPPPPRRPPAPPAAAAAPAAEAAPAAAPEPAPVVPDAAPAAGRAGAGHCRLRARRPAPPSPNRSPRRRRRPRTQRRPRPTADSEPVAGRLAEPEAPAGAERRRRRARRSSPAPPRSRRCSSRPSPRRRPAPSRRSSCRPTRRPPWASRPPSRRAPDEPEAQPPPT